MRPFAMAAPRSSILLEQRPATESPDVALINAIVTRTRSFDEADCEEWREALLVAPGLLDKATIHTPADKERAMKLIAERMGANPDVDSRPGLLSNSPLLQPISPSSSGYASRPADGRWIAMSPRRWKRSRARTGNGSRGANS